MKRWAGSLFQIALALILPLSIALIAIAAVSTEAHNDAMRKMMAHNDQETLRALALALTERQARGAASNEEIGALIRQLRLEHHGASVILTDETGRAIYHSEAAQIGQVVQLPGVAPALSGAAGALFTPQGYVVSYMPVNINGDTWGLVMQDPWTANSAWFSASFTAPAILVSLAGLALLVIGLGAHSLFIPLQKLDAQVAALGWGDLEAIRRPVGGVREIKELQQALIRMAGQLSALQQGMHGYIGAVTQAQEEERKRLARELHDDTAQSLVALKQQVHRIRRALLREVADSACALPQTEAALQEAQGMLDRAVEEVRRLSHALRPVYLEEAGLTSALEMLARDAGKQTSARVSFISTGDTRRLPDEVELALYRMAQEALNNALKHAQARRIHIQIDFAKEVKMRIEDDGVGFTQPQRVSDLVTAGHYGLMGIHERAQLVGAKLAIHSQPGQGTKIEAQLASP